jgi:gamma-glutamyltranspeptidase/glutathione hydrolase
MFRLILVALLTLSSFLSAKAQAQESNRPLAPEQSSGRSYSGKTAQGSQFMAVTAHPDATKVAYQVLSAGGTAADAGIAAQMVLGLVEPQSSGIGGGSFILYYDADSNSVLSLDGRETAPANAGPHLFTREDGSAMGFYQAAHGGRAVGVPGTLRALEKLHAWQGEMKWSDLFQPAISMASQGFIVSSRLHKLLSKESDRFDADIDTKVYFYPDSKSPIKAGSVKTNTDYASTLNYIALNGAASFYQGAPALNIIESVRKQKNAGLLSVEDMRDYQAKERRPLCGSYRGYRVCSMGQPSSGGLTLLNTLGILENFKLAEMGDSPQSWHIITEASRLAFSDRNQYMADADFVETPNELLLDLAYLKQRASLINASSPILEPTYGLPAGWNAQRQAFASDNSIKPPGTTHMSIVDKFGNILSMTSSIEHAFGARVMVDGYLLNNQLTDFAFQPNDKAGNPKANRVEGGKRPRSSMAPTIVFNPDGEPFMVIGSAGGSRIIGYVLQRIIAAIDWNVPIDKAVAAPHILHRGKKLELETSGVDRAESLKNFGHPVLVGEMNSGISAIMWQNGQMVGAADPRRDGTAMGE